MSAFDVFNVSKINKMYSNCFINSVFYHVGISDILQFLTCQKKAPLMDVRTYGTYSSANTSMYYQSQSATPCNDTVLMVTHFNEDQ